MLKPYDYSILRFVPNTFRGEYINVGVIVGNEDENEYILKTIDREGRARNFDYEGMLPAALRAVADLRDDLNAIRQDRTTLFPGDSYIDWLQSLHQSKRNILQLSNPSRVAAEGVDEAVRSLFDRYIAQPEPQKSDYPTVPRQTAQSELRKAYKKCGIEHDSENYAKDKNVRSNNFSAEFDNLIINGSALQLTFAVSFRVKGKKRVLERVKVWGWGVRDIRENGGEFQVRESEIDVPRSVDVALLYIPPLEDEPDDELQEAHQVAADSGAQFKNMNDAHEIAEQAAERLRETTAYEW